MTRIRHYSPISMIVMIVAVIAVVMGIFFVFQGVTNADWIKDAMQQE